MRLPASAASPALTRRLVLALATPCLVQLPALLPASATLVQDPRFLIDIPEGFVVSKRKATTGTIFVAGNFPRATVMSATAWPITSLLQDDAKGRDLPGLPASAQVQFRPGTETLEGLGSAKELALLLLRARDRDGSSGALQSVLNSSQYANGRLEFQYSTESPVADPDALEKERGVRQLIRRTAAASVLGSVPSAGGGQEPAIYSIFASALEQDWDKDLQAPLERAVKSFSLVTATVTQ